MQTPEDKFSGDVAHIVFLQFRENLQDVMKPDYDDHYLLRWLRGKLYEHGGMYADVAKLANWRALDEDLRCRSVLHIFTV